MATGSCSSPRPRPGGRQDLGQRSSHPRAAKVRSQDAVRALCWRTPRSLARCPSNATKAVFEGVSTLCVGTIQKSCSCGHRHPINDVPVRSVIRHGNKRTQEITWLHLLEFRSVEACPALFVQVCLMRLSRTSLSAAIRPGYCLVRHQFLRDQLPNRR
jgi:hypothetical protein